MVDRKLQLPVALRNRLKNQLASVFPLFQSALIAPAPVSLRLNPGKPTHLHLNEQAIPWSQFGKYLDSRPRFTDDPLFHAGTYYVQEASSMFLEYVVTNLVDLTKNLRVLDLSAAPGGKATHLQSLLTPDSLLVANEIIPSRNRILRQNLSRWGGDNHIVTQSDPHNFQKLPAFFDLILVDAPCSGEGMMRKDRQVIQEWSEDNVSLCSRRQKRILSDIFPALAPGGILIYSTCTFSEEENEENMEWIIEEKGLTPLPLEPPESWGILRTGPKQAGHRFYPHNLQGEGFFIAAFQKEDVSARRPKRIQRATARVQSELANEDDRSWLRFPDRYTFIQREHHRTAIPNSIFKDYLLVSRTQKVTSSGLYMGKVYHGHLKPSPELALSQSISGQIEKIELSREAALDYLSHINFSRGIDYPVGYNLIVYEGFGLGWIHVLGTGQVRNKYPSAWRILQRRIKQ